MKKTLIISLTLLIVSFPGMSRYGSYPALADKPEGDEEGII